MLVSIQFKAVASSTEKRKQKLINYEMEVLAVQMLDAVNLFHSNNILHRDIKPKNFLVSISHYERVFHMF